MIRVTQEKIRERDLKAKKRKVADNIHGAERSASSSYAPQTSIEVALALIKAKVDAANLQQLQSSLLYSVLVTSVPSVVRLKPWCTKTFHTNRPG
jgi:hypothetical protein